MIIPGGNHIDRRRTLTPREYLIDPHRFGVGRRTPFHVPYPPGGDPVSAKIARLQHELVLAWRATRPSGAGSRDARAFGISTSTWSRTVLGERWMGETVMAAVLRSLDLPR